MAGVLAVFGAASLVARPSQAFLGLGEEQQKEDDYKSFTVSCCALPIERRSSHQTRFRSFIKKEIWCVFSHQIYTKYTERRCVLSDL